MRVNQPNSSPAQSTGEASNAKRAGRAGAAQEAKGSARPAGAEAAKSEISGKAKEMAKAKAVASNAPDVREEKVAALKKRISEGSYSVDAQAVADRMVDEHMRTGIG